MSWRQPRLQAFLHDWSNIASPVRHFLDASSFPERGRALANPAKTDRLDCRKRPACKKATLFKACTALPVLFRFPPPRLFDLRPSAGERFRFCLLQLDVTANVQLLQQLQTAFHFRGS